MSYRPFTISSAVAQKQNKSYWLIHWSIYLCLSTL